ncbi:MAG: GNAT family N-acetyltransferase [Candidatus Heimdallarchaeota archaeon]
MPTVNIEKAKQEDAHKLALISKKAFDSDSEVGAPGPGGPPGYDTSAAQLRFMKFMDYYKILFEEKIVGGIFSRGVKHHRVLERIFVDPAHHNKGIAARAMELLWEQYPSVQLWTLGTPEWNVRTNHFYQKLGFIQIGWDDEYPGWRGIWYQKVMDSSMPYGITKIADLKKGMKDVTVEGVIHAVSASRRVKSRSTGKSLAVADAELRDNTGKVVLVLWNEQISRVGVEDRVRIEFGAVNTYKGIKQLTLSWAGRIITLV